MAAQNAERNTAWLEMSEKREFTDKHWRCALIVVVLIWLLAGPSVVHQPVDKINSHNRTLVSIIFEPVESNINSANQTPIWGKRWLSDVATRNLISLDDNYKRSGLIVVWAHVFVAVSFILYAFSIMRTNRLNLAHLYATIIPVVGFSLNFRTHFILEYRLDSSIILDLILWSVPEVILMIIARTIHVHSKPSATANNDEYDFGDKKSVCLKNHILYPSMILLKIFLLCLLCKAALSILNVHGDFKIVWNNKWSHIVATFVIIYLCLIIYHLLLMITSYIARCSFARKSLSLEDIVDIFAIITKYHLGTACYHATLIFPRIHTTFIINEMEFKLDSKWSTICRFYQIHWKFHNLSLMLTAAHGYNYSEAIRELLRESSTGHSLRLEKVNANSQIFRFWLSLLLAIYNLLLVLLWIHGVTINSEFTVRMWLGYVTGMYANYFIMKFLDTASNVYKYYYAKTNVVSERV